MTVGFKQDIAQYLAQSEIETRLLVVIEYDKDNVYRFIADESLESFEICGNTYLSTQIERGSRQENSDNSIDSVSLTLSNHWQEWAAIVANHGNEFLGKRCTLYEWFPEYPEDEPVPMYSGILDEIKMSATSFEMEVVRVLGDYDQEAPLMTYDPNCQFIYKDARCKSKSTIYYSCGKTLNDCIQRGNVLNFGGYVAVPREYLVKH